MKEENFIFFLSFLCAGLIARSERTRVGTSGSPPPAPKAERKGLFAEKCPHQGQKGTCLNFSMNVFREMNSNSKNGSREWKRAAEIGSSETKKDPTTTCGTSPRGGS